MSEKRHAGLCQASPGYRFASGARLTRKRTFRVRSRNRLVAFAHEPEGVTKKGGTGRKNPGLTDPDLPAVHLDDALRIAAPAGALFCGSAGSRPAEIPGTAWPDRQRKYRTGLGLAISKRIIEMHQQRTIWVESKKVPAAVSTFFVTLPVHAQMPPAVPQAKWNVRLRGSSMVPENAKRSGSSPHTIRMSFRSCGHYAEVEFV